MSDMTTQDKLLMIFITMIDDESFKSFVEEDIQIFVKSIKDATKHVFNTLDDTSDKTYISTITELCSDYIDFVYNELLKF